MPFKKLHSDIKEKLAHLEIITPTPFQRISIPAIKSGANIYCTASKDSGKTTTLILTTLQKLKCEAVGTAPRAVILVENKEKAYIPTPISVLFAFFIISFSIVLRVLATLTILPIN